LMKTTSMWTPHKKSARVDLQEMDRLRTWRARV
jgi:hypothetical protein